MAKIKIDEHFDLVGTENCWEVHLLNSRNQVKPTRISWFSKLEHACAYIRDARARRDCETLQEIIDLMKEDSCICGFVHKK